MGRNNTQDNTKTESTQNKKNKSMQNKKTYGWNGDNITLIFKVSARWRRWVRLMLPADLTPGGIHPNVR